MLQNYLMIVLRDFKKNPGFYLTNVVSLAIGIAACLLIAGYVRYNRSYDTQSPSYQDTYRIQYSRWGENDDRVEFASASPTIGPAIKTEFPEALAFARAYKAEGVFFYGDNYFKEEKVFRAETALFDILNIKILKGNAKNCLDEPSSIALSETAVKKYFGSEDPIGKLISLNKQQSFEVKAVFKDLDPNMHIKADIFLPMSEWMQRDPQLFSEGWFYSGFYTYVKFQPGTDTAKINKGITAMIKRNFGEILTNYKMGMSFELQPLKDIHLTSHYMHEIEPNGSKNSIDLLEIVGWFLLVIAWVNFFNLSTIASLRKQREIAIRKTNGASRLQLLSQLLVWSFLINLAAVLVSLVIFEIVYPWFSRLSGMPSNSDMWTSSWFYSLLALAFIVGTFSAGIYSTTGVYSRNLVDILRGGKSIQRGGVLMKKTLVTAQFAIGIALIAATIGVYLQFNFISKRDLGFKLDNILIVNAPAVGDSTLPSRYDIFAKEVSALPGIEGCAFSSVIPGQSNMFNRGGIHRFGDDPNNSKNYRVTETGTDFFKTYNIKFLSGEGFTGNKQLDFQRVVVNAYATMELGFKKPEEAVGQKIMMENRPYIISGVVIDFFQRSPKEAIEPQIFRAPLRFQGNFSINAGNQEPEKVISALEEKFKSIFPQNPYNAFFLKNTYNLQFEQEKRYSQVFTIFSLLVIFVTILGLVGLAAYTAEQRKKEIGIRKTLGASESWLFFILFKDYIWLCVIAAAIALPIFHYQYGEWIAGFALQLKPELWWYIIPVISVLLIAIVTVWLQSKRIIRLNPVENLKYE